jgi:phage repressor protein C with HTH and peptisase S24 domain
MSKADRLRAARIEAGYPSISAAARAMGVPIATYTHHENGTREFDTETAERYGKFFGKSPIDLMWETGSFLIKRSYEGEPEGRATTEIDPKLRALAASNATVGGPVTLTRAKIPILGHSEAGMDGRFILNGQQLGDALTPPSLEGVRNAYAVYIHGTSMEPRFEPGEIVYVNPNRPVRSGQYVVAQLVDPAEGEDGTPFAFVKRFISMNGRELRLEQLNPPEGEDRMLTFPRETVVSVHLIVGSAEG